MYPPLKWVQRVWEAKIWIQKRGLIWMLTVNNPNRISSHSRDQWHNNNLDHIQLNWSKITCKRELTFVTNYQATGPNWKINSQTHRKRYLQKRLIPKTRKEKRKQIKMRVLESHRKTHKNQRLNQSQMTLNLDWLKLREIRLLRPLTKH